MTDHAESVLRRFFPPIDKEALRELFASRPPADFFSDFLPTPPAQGDVLGPLPIEWIDGTERRQAMLPAILVSRGCDYDNDKFVLFAPCFPAERFSANKGFFSSAKLQQVASIIYLPPHGEQPALFADLTFVQAYPTDVLREAIHEGFVASHRSFTQIGFILFMLKVAYHFFRVEKDLVAYPPSAATPPSAFSRLVATIRGAWLGSRPSPG